MPQVLSALRRIEAEPSYGAVFEERFGASKIEAFAPYERGKNDAQRSFMKLLPEVTAYVQARVDRMVPEADRFQTNKDEIETTFLSEGGNRWLAHDQTHGAINREPASGMASLGQAKLHTSGEPGTFPAATVAAAKQSLRAMSSWLPPDVMQLDDPGIQANLRQYVFGIAGLYAQAKAQLVRDYRDLFHQRFADLPAGTQYFWSTLYFNAGAGHGHSQLTKKVIDPLAPEWMGRYHAPKRDPRLSGFSDGSGPHMSNPYHHALERTASLERLQRDRKSVTD